MSDYDPTANPRSLGGEELPADRDDIESLREDTQLLTAIEEACGTEGWRFVENHCTQSIQELEDFLLESKAAQEVPRMIAAQNQRKVYRWFLRLREVTHSELGKLRAELRDLEQAEKESEDAREVSA